MSHPNQPITDPLLLVARKEQADRDWDAQQKKRQETLAAYEAGGLAYHAAIRYIDGEPSKEAAAHAAFMSGNPYQMVSYSDEGHQRPAWFDGFNDAMAALYGVRQHEHGRLPATNGRSPYTGESLQDYQVAIEAAKDATDMTKVPHWAEDRGAYVSPRYAIVRAFQIGEPVSYGYNGDSYPCGRIVSMSKTAPVSSGVGPRIITVQDHNGNRRKFWRHRLTGSWREAGGGFSLQHGWHNDRNPSF
ncbi:hypothetical protein LESZY_00890 [Brevundimonas phage vB_BpoS-Leszy]|nr:hypothetical protein LESZY_00890 [Brevundimonas phage vB_BpoS-Leszy]